MTTSRQELLSIARKVAKDYQKQGYSLTLRQLYYALVSEDVIPNAQNSYKRLGSVIGEARLAGQFDMNLIIDRGRSAGASNHQECKVNVDYGETEAKGYAHSIPYWAIRTDRWFGQPYYVSVWVEKDALSGVFEKPCKDLGVGFFACKGYPSHSALWEWLKHLEEAYEASGNIMEDDQGNTMRTLRIEEAIVLYFGDHDPDGWQIPRSAEEAMNIFALVHGLNVPLIRFKRIALNMDQIEKYNPPPFPAKPSSTRYNTYRIEQQTQDAWELDALKPPVLDKLIRDSVEAYFDQHIRDRWVAWVRKNRKRLVERMADPSWIRIATGF